MSTTLDYAVPLPRHRAILRRVLIIGSIVFLSLSAGMGGIWVVRNASDHYWRNRCMNYHVSSDQVVMDWGSSTAYGYTPPEVSHLALGNWLPTMPTIFLHGLHLTGQPVRLIHVTAFAIPGEKNRVHFSPEIVGANSPAYSRVAVSYTQRCRIFAGQPDPSDAAHFTFVCEIDGARHLYDGWLLANDDVLIAERKPLGVN